MLQQPVLEYLADHSVLSLLTLTSWCLHIPGLTPNVRRAILECEQWSAQKKKLRNLSSMSYIRLTINEAVKNEPWLYEH
jgi:hypothetical protein